MDTVILVLRIVAGLMIVEAVVGVLIPGGMKKLANQFAELPSTTFPLMGGCLLAVTAITWGLILMDLPLVYWLLLFVGVVFATTAALCFLPGALQGFAQACVGDRKPMAIRLFYAAELAAAGIIIWVTLHPPA